MIINDNYIHSVKVNQWAVIEFLNRNNVNPQTAKNLKIEHLYLLFGIVRLYTINNTIYKTVNSNRFVLMTDKFILGNLPFCKCGNRMLKKRLAILKDYNFINTNIENRNTRYIFVSTQLLHLLGYSPIDISPITEVKKYLTKDFNKLHKEYSSKFKKNQLNDLIKSFDNSMHFEKYHDKENYNVSLYEVLTRLKIYLDKSLNNEYGYTKNYYKKDYVK